MEAKVHIALEAARKGCKELLRFADEVDKLDVIEKGPADYVTDLDKRVEKIIIDSLKKTYPHHTYISEEVGKIKGSGKSAESIWIIDPLDGTTNFIHGFPYYAISMAYVEKGKTLHALTIDVPRQDEYYASLGKGAYLNNKRLRVSRRKGLKGALLSNSSHNTDKGKLQHDNIEIVTKIQEKNNEESIPYTNKDKYEQMTKENPNLNKLKKELGLDFDF